MLAVEDKTVFAFYGHVALSFFCLVLRMRNAPCMHTF